jgi:hypothetical protein
LQIKKICKTPNICLLKSCRGHHWMSGCNRCVVFRNSILRRERKLIILKPIKSFSLNKELLIMWSECYWEEAFFSLLPALKIMLFIRFNISYNFHITQ